ncbi:hypothetical protein N657DRAFT_678130 [Parathielavia appendiculata]|uniref:Uncharacterized protein n=1 Tax=Parathielavia appendiculata TaxID=2587402 RepID=A0AAN6Z7J8_9PEZI|nr:hypothetical protein N657DRAFT_678130 [Parathielavia appendiculata]
MDLPKGGNSPASERLLPLDAREKTASGIESTNDNWQRPKLANTMPYLRRTIVVLLLCMLVLLGLASAGSPRVHCHDGATGRQTDATTSESFSDMLKSASPASLHELLHRYFPGRFRDGVFESEHKAMEEVHRANAALATSILQLAKRQEPNSTTSGDNPTPTVTEIETSTSTSTETETETQTETTTSVPPVDSTTSTTVGPTASTSSVAPPSSSNVPPASTGGSPSTTPTSTPSSSPPDTTLTTSTKPPAATTTAPPQTSKQIVSTFTSTSPNGVVVTVVATTYVPGDAAHQTGSSATSTRAPGSLQNAAVDRHSSGSILAGAVALVMLLIVV